MLTSITDATDFVSMELYGAVKVREGQIYVCLHVFWTVSGQQCEDYLFCTSRRRVSTLNDHFKGEPIKLQIYTNWY